MTTSERVDSLERDLLTLAVNKPNTAEIVAAMAPAAWQNPAHARIAQAIKELLASGEPVGVGTVGTLLGGKGINNWFNDYAAFSDCLTSKTATLPAEQYRRMIEEAAAKRKLQYSLNDAQRMLDEGHQFKDVAERITQTLPIVDLVQADDGYQPFPVDALPPALRTFVNEGSSAIGCDASYLALPVLTSLASAIGSAYQLEIKPGWQAKSILWCAVVGESGTAKTPAFNLVLKPWHSYQSICFVDHNKAMEEYAISKMLHERSLQKWKHEKQGIRSNPPVLPPPPQAKRVLVDDPTVHAMASIFQANPRGLFLAKDELSSWFMSFDQFTKGGDASKYLSMYGGLPFTVDRKTGQPPTIHVPKAFLSICGGIQPKVLQNIWAQGQHRETGMAARFMVTYPPRKPKVYSESIVDSATEGQWAALVGQLLNLNQNECTLRLSSDAKARGIAWFNQHNHEQSTQVGEMAAAFSKLEEIPYRLAIVLHLARYFSGEAFVHLEVDRETIESAITLTEWFKNEARRIYRLFGSKVRPSSQQALLNWVKEQNEPVTPRDVAMHLREYRGTGGSERARVALDALVTAGQCERDQDGNYLPTRQHANMPTADCVGVGSVGTNSEQSSNRKRVII